MKKLLLLAVATVVLMLSMATPLKAEDTDDPCPCGQDEMGDCMPCDDAE